MNISAMKELNVIKLYLNNKTGCSYDLHFIARKFVFCVVIVRIVAEMKLSSSCDDTLLSFQVDFGVDVELMKSLGFVVRFYTH